MWLFDSKSATLRDVVGRDGTETHGGMARAVSAGGDGGDIGDDDLVVMEIAFMKIDDIFACGIGLAHGGGRGLTILIVTTVNWRCFNMFVVAWMGKIICDVAISRKASMKEDITM